MKKTLLLFCWMMLIVLSGFAQINFSANDFNHIPAYNGNFQYGANMGYYGPSWDDMTLSDIAAGNPAKNVKGAGVKSLHLTLPESFLDFWGYNVRVDFFSHYASLGIKDNTIFLEDPIAAHRDPTNFGCTESSRLFKNMYEPIWDGGANGTPVNDNNYLALYIWKTVTAYKQYVKYWEIINEPDLEWGQLGDGDPGTPGNWWENNPPPCSLPNLFAPIFQYIRALRIGYEVVKYVDPTAFVSPGGLGKPGFLDAILRNTDNPTDGSATSAYPLKGGAYFDALSIHFYPMYSLHQWDNSIFGFVFSRHSDAAINKYIEHVNKFASTLSARGYNGTTYPGKHLITTENNIPNKSVNGPIGAWIGSPEAQRNYVIKALVESQKNKLDQYYVFVLGNDRDTWDASASELNFLGLYQNLVGKGPLTNGGVYGQQYNESGIAYKTTSDLLIGKRFDAAGTTAMNLPSNIGGAAFKDDAGVFTYVLWAKTTVDMSESTSGTYSFPAGLVSAQLTKKEWDFTNTQASSTIASTNISLTGTPIFVGGSTSPPPPPGGCDNVIITPASGSINITGLNSPVATVQVFNSSWTTVYSQTLTNSPGNLTIPSLTAGTYHVNVSFYTAGWSPVCNKSADAIVQSGNTSGDCNSITITPTSNAISITGLTAPVITVQIFSSSWATVYNQAFTNSPGTLTTPTLAAGTYHVKVNFNSASWTGICEKSQDVVIQSGSGNPDCNTISITPGSGVINLNGLVAPVITVQIWNSNWATVYNQTFTNSPSNVTVSSLSAGTYHVKVNFNTSSWSAICEKFVDVNVSPGSTAASTASAMEQKAAMNEFTRMVAAPNPFSNAIQITIGSRKNESASLVIMDVLGRQLYKKPVSLQKGINRFTLDGGKYIPGNYYLKLVTADRSETVKMIKQ